MNKSRINQAYQGNFEFYPYDFRALAQGKGQQKYTTRVAYGSTVLTAKQASEHPYGFIGERISFVKDGQILTDNDVICYGDGIRCIMKNLEGRPKRVLVFQNVSKTPFEIKLGMRTKTFGDLKRKIAKVKKLERLPEAIYFHGKLLDDECEITWNETVLVFY